MNMGNIRAVYLLHSPWFLAPNRFTWKLAFHLKPPEKRVSREPWPRGRRSLILSVRLHAGRALGNCQWRMASWRTLSASWLHRRQHGEARRKRRRLLQQAGRPYMKKVIIS